MVAGEVFVNCYDFSPIMVKHATIHVKSTNTQVKKKLVKVSYKTV